MKYFFPSIFKCLFTILTTNLVAQTTWVKTPYIQSAPAGFVHDSTHVGPTEMCLTPNGTVISIVQINENGDKKLYGIDSLGSLVWSIPGSINGGIQTQTCKRLVAKPDNGCVYIFEYYGSMLYSTIYNLNSLGGIVWSKTYNISLPFMIHPIYVVPTYQNTCFVMMSNDSLVELNASGNFMRQRSLFSGQITALPDTDFILCNPPFISRENFTGNNQRWNINAPNFYVVSADSFFVYAISLDSVMKINSINGNVIWTKPVLSSMMSVAPDGSFIIIDTTGNNISAYDSSGIHKWIKHIDLPHYELTSIVAGLNNLTYAGGCWKINKLLTGYTLYAPLIFNLNASGNGIIDSTNYYYVGNANDNYKLSFADDAVYIAAALNSTGPQRDLLIRNNNHSSWNPDMNVFGTDWQDSFECGMNYKFSDFDGNGRVDSVDIRHLAEEQIPNNFQVNPHYLRLAESNSNPDINFAIDYGSMDTIKVNVIMGNNMNRIDSIYGISFEYSLIQNLPPFRSMTAINYSITPSAFGDTSSNLFVFQKARTITGISTLIYTSEVVLCRNDHQNIALAGDTIITLNFVPDNAGVWTDTIFTHANVNAIYNSGCSLSLNVINEPLITSRINKISSIENNQFSTYPNPSSGGVYIKLMSPIQNCRLRIYNDLGKLMSSHENISGDKIFINREGLSNGMYFFSIQKNNSVIRGKFVLE